MKEAMKMKWTLVHDRIELVEWTMAEAREMFKGMPFEYGVGIEYPCFVCFSVGPPPSVLWLSFSAVANLEQQRLETMKNESKST